MPEHKAPVFRRSQPVGRQLHRITEEVEYIRSAAGDAEMAHVYEDSLHRAVLRAISTGSMHNPEEAARRAIKTTQLSFARWCA